MAEFALPNRPSTHTTNSYNKTFIKSDNNSSSTNESNVDLSWLPNYNDNNKSYNSSHQNAQNDFDDSWLPNYNDTKRKTSTNTSKSSSNSNRPHKTKNDSDDYSWLPPTPSVKTQSKNKGQNHTKNKDSSSTALKSNHFQKTEASSHNVNKGDKKKENNNNNKLRNNGHLGRAHEATASSTDQQIQQPKVWNGEPESTTPQRQVSLSGSECSVETDSLGGVSTLLRRWKDQLDETKNSNTKLISKHPSSSKSGTICASPSTTDHDSSGDMEFCKSSPSRPLSCVIPSRGTNDVENEKIRVGEIIYKLSKEEVELAARNINAVENKCVSPVIGKKRLIRGRQAYMDFLILVERDKRRELEILTQRKPVSKFPNCGRIQAMLRVRLIRLGVEPKSESKSHKRSVSKTMKTIWDKFSTGVKQGTAASRRVNNINGEGTKGQISPKYSVGCTPVREVEVNTNAQELESTTTCSQPAQEAQDHHEIMESTKDKGQDVDSSYQSVQTKEDTCSETLVSNRPDHHENNQFHSEKMFFSEIDEKGLDELQSDTGLENYHDWNGEYSYDWDEEEFYHSHDWIREIARPKSDWEYMRQKRYQEMLHLYSYNQDLQELLKRRSVSIFLLSDQRNKLDQLMVSRTQGILHTDEVSGIELKKEKGNEDGGRRSERQCNEYNDFIDQPTCSSTPSRTTSWSQPNTIYESDQMASQSPFPSQSLWHMPCNNNPQPSSIEMELIYDLRGYVEQLHQEIMELRKSVTTMQMQQSVEKQRSEPISTKGNCCVCYATQADSFLYKCGHMRTCYSCGLELQCTSGKCPICEASIVDVVRAHGYNE